MHYVNDILNKWQLLFNVHFKLLVISLILIIICEMMESLHLENVEDLGITINSHLKFYQHYSLVISKSNRNLGIIAKVLKFLNVEMSLTIYIISLWAAQFLNMEI